MRVATYKVHVYEIANGKSSVWSSRKWGKEMLPSAVLDHFMGLSFNMKFEKRTSAVLYLALPDTFFMVSQTFFEETTACIGSFHFRLSSKYSGCKGTILSHLHLSSIVINDLFQGKCVLVDVAVVVMVGF